MWQTKTFKVDICWWPSRLKCVLCVNRHVSCHTWTCFFFLSPILSCCLWSARGSWWLFPVPRDEWTSQTGVCWASPPHPWLLGSRWRKRNTGAEITRLGSTHKLYQKNRNTWTETIGRSKGITTLILDLWQSGSKQSASSDRRIQFGLGSGHQIWNVSLRSLIHCHGRLSKSSVFFSMLVWNITWQEANWYMNLSIE